MHLIVTTIGALEKCIIKYNYGQPEYNNLSINLKLRYELLNIIFFLAHTVYQHIFLLIRIKD